MKILSGLKHDVKNIGVNKIYVLGDVHGCYHTLLKLLEKISSHSRIIFVGDLVDKGKYSKEVIELIIENNYEVILGNHEYLMFNNIREAIIDKDYTSDWARMKGYGGSLTIKNYENDLELLSKHLMWIEKLPRYLIVKNYFITHGFGLPYYNRRDKAESKYPLFSNRINDDSYNEDWEDYSNYKMINIFGHCVFDDVLCGKNYYGIDTGCAYGNKLTAIELGTMNLIQQDALVIDLCNNIKLKRYKK